MITQAMKDLFEWEHRRAVQEQREEFPRTARASRVAKVSTNATDELHKQVMSDRDELRRSS